MKVVLTQEQAAEIEDSKSFGVENDTLLIRRVHQVAGPIINTMAVDILAKALYIGYVVEGEEETCWACNGTGKLHKTT